MKTDTSSPAGIQGTKLTKPDIKELAFKLINQCSPDANPVTKTD